MKRLILILTIGLFSMVVHAQTTPQEIAQSLIDALNAGDAETAATLFAPEARFDSIGRIYEGRDEIMERFLVPEVINLGGQYEILNVTPDPEAQDVVTVEYNFSAGELREHFYYRYTIRDGLIIDVVGDYL